MARRINRQLTPKINIMSPVTWVKDEQDATHFAFRKDAEAWVKMIGPSRMPETAKASGAYYWVGEYYGEGPRRGWVVGLQQHGHVKLELHK